MESRWSLSEAEPQDPLDQLVTMSRLLGAEPGLVVWGGGNTSLKVQEPDFRGRPTAVLRVKGSGSDMKSITRAGFSPVRMEDVLPLFDRLDMSDEEMVEYLRYALLEPGAPRPSIETLLHAFVPFAAVAHSHADSILSLCNSKMAQQTVRDALGEATIQIPYRRPGFLLSKEVGEAVVANPEAAAVVLMNHGLITWGKNCLEAYERHIEIVSQAERYLAERTPARPVLASATSDDGSDRRAKAALLAPAIRGSVSGQRHMVLRLVDTVEVLGFANSNDAQTLSQIGAATPDHILSTKFKPLFVPVVDADIDSIRAKYSQSLEQWRAQYDAYFERNNSGEETLAADPRVIIVPGIGVWTTGKDARAAQIPADIYEHTIRIIAGAQSVGGYRTLAEKDAFEAEYWPLELYKLKLAGPDLELAGRVALVTGAAQGIGKAIAAELSRLGAHVAICDLDSMACQQGAKEICERHGAGRAFGFAMDVTDEAQVASGVRQVVLEYGGLDILVSNAGIGATGRIEDLELSEWDRSFAVNARGHFLVSREAIRVMRAQGIGGSIVFNVSKNVPAPGADFGPYSCAKAAEAQLARIIAVENGAWGIRSNMLNPDAVFDAGFWTPELRANRANAQGFAPDALEEHYRNRNLLKARVTSHDVAMAAAWLASDRSSKTTGAMIPVDGGLREAFPR